MRWSLRLCVASTHFSLEILKRIDGNRFKQKQTAGAQALQKGWRLIGKAESRCWTPTKARARGQKNCSCTFSAVSWPELVQGTSILCSTCLGSLICQVFFSVNYTIELHNYSSGLPLISWPILYITFLCSCLLCCLTITHH